MYVGHMISDWNQLYINIVLLPYGDCPNTSDISFPEVYNTEEDTSPNEPLIENGDLSVLRINR